MSLSTVKTYYANPVAQVSTNAYVVYAGSEVAAKDFRSVSYTIKAVTESVKWKVYGANLANYTDEVEVQAEATVLAAAASSYAVAQAPYAYYRVKITDGSGHSTATVTGLAKG
jgi:hypothetical protein